MKPHPPTARHPKPIHKRVSSKAAIESSMMTVNEVTTLLHCHRVTILRLIERGQLYILKSGGEISFQRAEVSALANRNIAVYPHLTIARRPS